jgi:hypothetical protein
MKLKKLNTKEEILKKREGAKDLIFNGQFKFILTLCLILEQMLHINIKSNTILLHLEILLSHSENKPCVLRRALRQTMSS